MKHGYKTQHSTVTALHTLNNTVAKGFNQMAPPARTTTVALDMSKLKNFKLAFHKVASFHPHYLLIIYTSDLPPPSAPVQVMAYADDITITSTHTSTSAANKYIQPYLHKFFSRAKQNKTTKNYIQTKQLALCSRLAEYASNLDLKINNNALPMATHPNVLGLTLDPKLTYSRTLVGLSQFSIPWLEPLIESSILLPLVSVDLEYHDE